MPTPEEQRVLDDIKAKTEAGEDPFGDDEPATAPAASPAAASEAEDGQVDEQTTTADQQDGQTSGQQAGEQQPGQGNAEEIDLEVLADIADPLQLNRPVTYKAEVPADLRERRVKLMGEKSAAMKKLMDGEIDAEEFAAEDLRIADELDAITRQQVRAETLTELNTQTTEQYSVQSLNALIRRTKSEVDYKTDPEAPKQFDRSLRVLLADPENEGRDIAEVYEDAHKMVLAMRGISNPKDDGQAKDGAKAKDGVPDRRPGDPAPVTLRNLPAASQSNTGGGVVEQLSRLSGPAYEAAFSKLTPAQRAQLLDED